MIDLNTFDNWLQDNDTAPAALVIREHLMSVEGVDGVVFPPTFAAGGAFKGGYNIDDLGKDDQGNCRNVCLLDSVGSQANRIESLFL
jgi:CRISPR-associated protein Csb1